MGAARSRARWLRRLRPARAAPLGLLAIFCALAGPGLALDPQRRLSEYRSMVWSDDTGLFQEWIDSIAQTPDGYLWLGGHEGLTRFDGKRFVSLAPFKDVMVPDRTVNDLRVDAAGRLWVASYGAIYCCQRAGEDFQRFDAAQGLPADWVRCLLFTPDGRLWAGTDSHGLFVLERGRFAPYAFPSPLPCWRVTALAQGADGGLWVGSAAGLVRIGPDGEPPRGYTQADGLPDDHVSALATDAQGQLWAGTHRGLARLDHDRFVAVPLGGTGSPAVGALLVDRRDSLWVACVNAGLERLEPATLQSESVTFPPGAADGNFKRIFEDREGNVWLGSDAGVRCLSDAQFTVVSSQDGLPNRTVNAVCSGRDGRLWIGTEGGLTLWRRGRLEPIAVSPEGQGTLRQGVTSLHEDRQGTLWFGTAYGGLYALRDGRVAEVPLQTRAFAPAYAPVSVIREDQAGTLWVGTFGEGLQAVAGGKVVKTLTRDDGLKSDFVTDLAPSPIEGALWVATDHGVSVLNGGKPEAPVAAGAADPEEKFVSLYLDSEGVLWAGTMGGGINRLKGGRWGPAFCTKAQGLFSDEIFSILEDQRGHLAQLWTSGNRGIVSIPKAELDDYFDGRRSTVSCQVFGREDGLRSVQCAGANQPSGCVTPEGQLCFPTTDGVAMIAPEKVRYNAQAPLTQIERMLVDVTQSVPLGPGRKPALGAGTHSVEFDYAGLSFSAPRRVLFKYQLEGFDQGWVEAGVRAEAYYTNLAPGTYRFRVIACNNDGVWTPKEEAASVSFAILPHFYQTFWFYLLCALALGVTLWLLARWRLQQVLAERNRLARELHDTLAQSFLALLWQIESAEIALAKGLAERAQASLQRAKGQARDGLKETRRAVQALRAGVLEDAGSFPAALTALVRKAADGTGLAIEVRQTGAPYPLREAWEQTLLRVAQEALHNALKHAQARSFEVGLDYEDAKRFRLYLRDDGKGFEVGSWETGISPGGSTVSGKMGLRCMHERCRRLGGELRLSSRPGAGTCIEVQVPVRPRLLRRLRALGRRFWPGWDPFGAGARAGGL